MSTEKSKMFKKLTDEQREFILKWFTIDDFVEGDKDEVTIKTVLSNGMYNLKGDFCVLNYYRQKWKWIHADIHKK